MFIEITKKLSDSYPYKETVIVNTANITRIERIDYCDSSGGYDGEFMRSRIFFTGGSSLDVTTGYNFLCKELDGKISDWTHEQ